MEHASPLQALSDDVLLRRLHELLRTSRNVESELVSHIGEVDLRRLYAREASPSMFAYCTQVLHLSEHEAYLRIAVARASRQHPLLLTMLADGRLHLSGIAKLAPHLTAENRDTLLARAAHKSKREIDELVAELAPRPDVPAMVRKLPQARQRGPLSGPAVEPARPPGPAGEPAPAPGPAGDPARPPGPAGEPAPAPGPAGDPAPASGQALRPADIGTGGSELGPDRVAAATRGSLGSPACGPSLPGPADATSAWVPAGSERTRPALAEAPAAARPRAVDAPPPPAVVEAPAPGRYKVQFTASAELRDKLDRLQALLPGADLAQLIEQAISEKLARLEARRFARTKAPRPGLAEADAVPSSRYIPAAVRRAVHERDEGRCTYSDDRGRRCSAQANLEFHHHGRPYARGGEHSVANLRLMCRAHNVFHAELDFGKDEVARYRRTGGSVFEPSAVYSSPG